MIAFLFWNLAGNVETSQAVTDTLFGALGAMAAAQGTMNNTNFGNARYQYYETICGGSGAGPGFDGTSAVHTHMTNTRLTDPEVLEFRYPVILEKFEIRRGSGGKGRWTGGDGVTRARKSPCPRANSMRFASRRTRWGRRIVPRAMVESAGRASRSCARSCFPSIARNSVPSSY